ncbi:hypothetical protein FCV25MIE_32272 [Fagus crenata]
MECEFSKISREEEAELQRSTKKVKENPLTAPFGSYKDKLTRDIPGAYLQAFDLEKVSDEEALSDPNDEDDLHEEMASPPGEKEDQATDTKIEKVENMEGNDTDGKSGRKPINRQSGSPIFADTIHPNFMRNDLTHIPSEHVDQPSSDTEATKAVDGKCKLVEQPIITAGFNLPGLSSPSVLIPELNSCVSPRPSSRARNGKRSKGKGKGKGQASEVNLRTRGATMGYSSQRTNYGDSSGHLGPHSSNPDSNHGVVRSGVNECLEIHISSDKREPLSRHHLNGGPSLAGVGKPLVGVLDRSPISERGKNSRVEEATFSFSGANLMRIEPVRSTNRKANVGGQADCSELLGKHAGEKATPSISPEFPVQSLGVPKGNEHGNHGAHNHYADRGRFHQEVPEGDGMELEGADEVSSSD